MNVKETKFVEEKLKGKSNTESAINAGFSKRSAYNQGSRMMRKDEIKAQIQSPIQKVLITNKITAKKLIQPYLDALQANKTIVMGKDEDSFVDIQPDHNIRMKAADKLLKLSGLEDQKNAQPILNNQELIKALNDNVDDVELVKMTFSKKDDV